MKRYRKITEGVYSPDERMTFDDIVLIILVGIGIGIIIINVTKWVVEL